MRAIALAVALALPLSALATDPPADTTETLLAVYLDGDLVIDTAMLYRSEDGDVWLTVEDWKSLPGLSINLVERDGLVSARELGIKPRFMPELQAVSLTVPAASRPYQRLGRQPHAPVESVNAQPKGVLVNYDVAGRFDTTGRWNASVGHKARFGVGAATVSTLGQLNHSERGTRYTRSLTTLHYDDLGRGIAYEAGDVFTPRSNLSGPVNLAGARVGTDRALRRHHNFLPVPTLGGVVEDASTAELFVNGRRTAQHSLTAGPWEVDHYPVSPGSNAVRVVVRDDFGREQVIEDHFYLSQTNLPKGTLEWEVAAGLVRQGGDRYDMPAVAASVDRGLTDTWTAGAQVEATADAQALGVSSSIVLGRAGVITADARATRSEQDSGTAASVSYAYRGDSWGFNAGHSRYSVDHWSLGQARGELYAQRRLARSSAASATFHPKGSPFSASLSAADLEYADGTRRQRLDLSGRWRNREHAVGVGVGYTPHDGAMAWATYRYSFGQNRSFTATVRQNPDLALQARMSGKSAVGARQVRWNAGAGVSEGNTIAWAQASANTPKGPISVDVRHGRTGTEAFGRFQSSVWAGEGGVATQRPALGASFLVVEVPGQEGVPVSSGGGWETTTNRNGVAVVPNVMPLVPQRVSIDAKGLDLSVGIENTTETAVVGRHGGGKVEFEVFTESMLEIRLTYQGAPVASPAEVTSNTERALVGRGGAVVLMNPTPGQELIVNGSVSCHARLPMVLPGYDTVLTISCEEAP